MTDFASRRRLMVDTQVRPADVTKFPIIDAMLRVPREVFVPDSLVEAAYVGDNLAVAPRRVVLDPRTLAKMLDALNLRAADVVLDIGCNYGYSAAVMAQLVEAVVAVEEDTDLAREAETILSEQGIDNVAVLCAPHVEGAPKHGPYDAIVLQGAVETVPDAILAQLKDGGCIVALFSEQTLGVARLGYKVDGAVSWRFAFNAGAPVLPGFEKARDFAF